MVSAGLDESNAATIGGSTATVRAMPSARSPACCSTRVSKTETTAAEIKPATRMMMLAWMSTMRVSRDRRLSKCMANVASLTRVEGHRRAGDLCQHAIGGLARIRGHHVTHVDVLHRVVRALIEGEQTSRAPERNRLQRADQRVSI